MLENVAFPLAIKRVPRAERNQRALELLKSFEIDHRAFFYPTELSGGQQQRVEVARALITDPDILVADEPTGNLDTASAKIVMNFFEKINEERGITVIMVTHNMEYIRYATQTIQMQDGQVLSGDNQFKFDASSIEEDEEEAKPKKTKPVKVKQDEDAKPEVPEREIQETLEKPESAPKKKTLARKRKTKKRS